MARRLGAIEAGGTKVSLAVGGGPHDIEARLRLATTTPDETLGQAFDFLRSAGPLDGVGIASFGPLDLKPGSATYGHITATPKPGWAGVDLAGRLAKALGVTVAIDTDVNGAAWGERRWGAGAGLDDFVYVTIGTGIGGGVVAGGKLVHGLIHPEIGHVLVPRHEKDGGFAGICPFHGACLEGLASGPALAARWSLPAEALPENHPAWEMEAHYLAVLCLNLSFTLSPQRIILGGGVMARPALLSLVRRKFAAMAEGYVPILALAGGVEGYIVAPMLGQEAGLAGAFALIAERLEAGQNGQDPAPGKPRLGRARRP
ncbi:MAG: ROK family protein [Pseudomonadota bacterium]